MKKYVSIALLLLATSFIFLSCESNEYNDTLTSQDIADRLKAEISALQDYAEYDTRDLSYAFDKLDEKADTCVLYSRDSDDQGEIGIFKASEDIKIDTLIQAVSEYIECTKEERKDFIENYIPEELAKLEDAEIRKYGDYIVFTLLEYDKARQVYDFIEDCLKSP